MQAARGTPIAQTAAEQPPLLTVGRRRRLLGLFAAVALTGLALDVVTKIVVVDRLPPLVPVRLLGGALTLRLIRNSGAAFSSGEHFTALFALAACAVLVFVGIKLVPRIGHPAWAVALGLLCAGVAGNLSDRLFRAPGVLRGHVVDFLQLPHWPIFNVADMCITGAAVLIMVLAVIKNVGIGGERYARSERPRRG
ncbi:signal peptidase II [uncultured Friedmanniella sp.]|uniref:signal peptidase II n=1 Tax=uncultured Friedmanniella sp. TaxID=335381 RepID=UPI0035C999D1